MTNEDFLEKLKSSGGTTKRASVHNNKSVRKQRVLDVQWSDCPLFVEEDVRSLWSEYELGNDNYMITVLMDEELLEEHPCIYWWLKHNGVEDNMSVWVHWWW